MISFSASILIPIMNETFSLRETVDIILNENPRSDLKEIIIIYGTKTTSDCMLVAQSLITEHPDLIIPCQQSLPFLGGAIRAGFAASRGTHTLMMSSDLETDPVDVKHFIALAKENPEVIITASRWRKQGKFEKYNPVKLFLNWIFQRAFSIIYFTSLSDMTYGYRIFPTALIQSIHWTELRHPFLLETIVKPLRLGIKTIEIPTIWKARKEGESQNTFLRNFEYFKIGLQVRFMNPNKIKNQSQN